MQNKCNSIAITLELLLFCIKSSIFRGCNSGNGKVNDCFRSKLLPSDMCIFLHTAPSSPDGEDRPLTPPPSASSSSGDATPSTKNGKCTMIVALLSPYSFMFLTYNNFSVKSLRLTQNGYYLADNIFKFMFFSENCSFNAISIDNKPLLVEIMGCSTLGLLLGHSTWEILHQLQMTLRVIPTK